MDEQFYGDPQRRIKGAIDQLVDGDKCFAFLYNVGEGESGPKRTLKSFCCSSDTSSMFVAGVHFTAKMISTKLNKKLSGQTLWTAEQTVHCSIKKDMAIVPKLDGKIVNLAKNNKVVGYTSGKNLKSFIQFIDNGMYTLSLNKGKAVNEDKEDNDDVVEEVVNDSVSKRIDSWDPFNSVVAPKGYCFFGKLSFLCLGPASAYYVKTLLSTPRQTTLVEEKKMMGQGAMKKEISTQKSVDPDVGGSDRGMSLATKASVRFMAQNKDDAVQHHHDMHWATLTKMIDTEQRMIDVCQDEIDGLNGHCRRIK